MVNDRCNGPCNRNVETYGTFEQYTRASLYLKPLFTDIDRERVG